MRTTVGANRSLALAGTLLVLAGTAAAQDINAWGRFEVAPDFEYLWTSSLLGGSQSYACAGGGGTITVNFNHWLGIASDLDYCHLYGFDNVFGVGSKVVGNQFTYLFGPRITYRKGRFQPFGEVYFGGDNMSLSCHTGNFGNLCGGLSASQLPVLSTLPPIVVVNPTKSSVSQDAFAMTAGIGLDIKLSRRVAFRMVQAEYLYTRFANGCQSTACNNNNQNSFRITSGIVMNFGATK